MCDCYRVKFSIYTVIADLIGVTVNCVTLIELVLISYCYCSTDCCYSELWDCYWVPFSIYTVIVDLICVTVNFVTVFEFSSQYILLLLTWLVLHWIVWLLFSSVLNLYCNCWTEWCYSVLCDFYSVHLSINNLIAKLIGVRVNCVAVIYISAQYILLLLNCLVLQLQLQLIVRLLFSKVLNTYFIPEPICVSVDFLGVIEFSLQYILFLLNYFLLQ